jgi:hypothetical protein
MDEEFKNKNVVIPFYLGIINISLLTLQVYSSWFARKIENKTIFSVKRDFLKNSETNVNFDSWKANIMCWAIPVFQR